MSTASAISSCDIVQVSSPSSPSRKLKFKSHQHYIIRVRSILYNFQTILNQFSRVPWFMQKCPIEKWYLYWHLCSWYLPRERTRQSDISIWTYKHKYFTLCPLEARGQVLLPVSEQAPIQLQSGLWLLLISYEALMSAGKHSMKTVNLTNWQSFFFLWRENMWAKSAYRFTLV